ncbi:T4 family baseplate hub assembly chaperone [Streptomyces sp. NPDC004980]
MSGETPPARVREFEFELPVGFEDADNQIHRTAVLRKMTGRDEAVMADKRYRNNGAKLISELIGNCLVRLGTIEHPGVRTAQQLYSTDRHFLLVKLREITFGQEMQATYSCPTCQEATVLVEDLAELEVVRLSGSELLEDLVVQLEDGYVDRSGTVFDTLVFRHPTGADEERIASVVRENASQGKNALMARCLKAMGDMPRPRLEALGSALFSDLTLSDRHIIDQAMKFGGTGINMQRSINCGGCGREYGASIDMSNFLVAS